MRMWPPTVLTALKRRALVVATFAGLFVGGLMVPYFSLGGASWNSLALSADISRGPRTDISGVVSAFGPPAGFFFRRCPQCPLRLFERFIRGIDLRRGHCTRPFRLQRRISLGSFMRSLSRVDIEGRLANLSYSGSVSGQPFFSIHRCEIDWLALLDIL